MADISSLSIAPNEPLDFNAYQGAGQRRPFPGKGRYTLRATESFGPESFQPNKANTALTVQIDPTIVDGPEGAGVGRTLKYTRVSAKTYKRGNTTVSQLGDYLKACGLGSGTLPGDAQAQADAAERTAGAVFEAKLDWRLFGKGEGYTINADGTRVPTGQDLIIDGMENFPSDGNGGYVPYVDSLINTNPETGEPKRLFAQLTISEFCPQS